jgi:threonine dehydrogenase-like Zn-dependent dehydrogenase
MAQMFALRACDGDTNAQLKSIDIPALKSQDVLVKVVSAGLAPGLFNVLGKGLYKSLPMTLGQEAAGVVAAVGEGVSSISVGDRVRLHPNLACRSCKSCHGGLDQMCPEIGLMGFVPLGSGPMPLYEEYRNGALAEYVRTPYWLIDKLPQNVSFDVGAKVHMLANALSALKAAFLKPGATVLIAAATGGMATATLKLATFFPISRIILLGRSAERLQAVQSLTTLPTDIVAIEELEEDWQSTGGLVRQIKSLAPLGVEAILDYVPGGGQDLWQMMGALQVGGTLVHVGANMSVLPLPLAAIMAKGWRIVGVRANSREDAAQVLEFLAAGHLQVDDLITHRFPLHRADQAVSTFRSRIDPIWMAVINP